MTEADSTLGIFEPLRAPSGEPLAVAHTFPAYEVTVIYYSVDGRWASLLPFPQQRTSYAAVYAPGLSHLAVYRADFSPVDYASDTPATCTVTSFLYENGETYAVTETAEQAISRRKAGGSWVDIPTLAHQS